MPMPNKNVPVLLLWLLPLLMVSACATRSEPLPPPVVGEKPKALPMPSSIADIDPPPSGSYTTKLTEEFAGAAEKHADEIRALKRIIGNDRALTE